MSQIATIGSYKATVGREFCAEATGHLVTILLTMPDAVQLRLCQELPLKENGKTRERSAENRTPSEMASPSP